jgi:hypothetical protein
MIIVGVVDAGLGALYISAADEFARNDPNNGKDFYKGIGIVSIVTGVILAGIGIPLAMSSTDIEVQ